MSSIKLDLKQLSAGIKSKNDTVQNTNNEIDEVITDLITEFKINTTNSAIYHFDSIGKANIDIKRLEFNMSSYAHRIDKFNAKIDINKDDIDVKELHFDIDKNHLDAHINMKNILAIGGKENKKVVVDFDISSPHLNLHNLLMFKGESSVEKESMVENLKNIKLAGEFSTYTNDLSNFTGIPDINLELRQSKLDFVKVPKKLQSLSGKIVNKGNELTFNNTKIRFANADFYLDGKLENYFDENPNNDLISANLKAELIDLNEIILPFLSDKIEESEAQGEPYNIFAEPFPNVALKADVKKFKYDRYLMEDIKLDTEVDANHVIKLNNLQMNAAEGKVKLNGVLDGSDKDNIFLKSVVDVQNLCLEKVFFKFDNFGQESLVQENIQGYITSKVESNVPLQPDLTFELKDIEAKIDAKIKDGRIINFEPFLALNSYMGFRDLSNVKFGELENKMTLSKGKITIPKMTINSSLGYMVIDGTKTVDQYIDFQVQVPASLVKRAAAYSLFNRANTRGNKGENKKEDEIIFRSEGGSLAYVFVHILGHIDDFNVNMGKRKK